MDIILNLALIAYTGFMGFMFGQMYEARKNFKEMNRDL